MKELGILGGMGPLATANFYERIVLNTKADKDQEHIKTMIISDTDIPDRSTVIMNNLDHSLLLDVVKEDLKLFEAAGVQRISAPCNTFHYFYDEVQALTNIKIINMIEETIKYIDSKDAKRIAVLASKGTISSGVFEKYAIKYGIETVQLDESTKDFLMDTIYETKASGKTEFPEFLKLVEDLNKDGAEIIVVACTELSLIEGLDKYSDIMVDSMDVLVRESITQLGYKLNSK